MAAQKHVEIVRSHPRTFQITYYADRTRVAHLLAALRASGDVQVVSDGSGGAVEEEEEDGGMEDAE